MPSIVIYTLITIYAATIAGIILVIIIGNKNPLKAIPWVLVLLFAPVVGVVFYYFFGQDLRKEKIISRRTYKRIMTRPMLEMPQNIPCKVPEQYTVLSNLLLNTARAIVLPDSRITTYTNGEDKMEALLESIASACHHIHIEYYIFMDDAIGCRIKDALIDKACEGVTVRILYDDVGSRGVKEEFFEQMRRAGIKVSSFLHVKFPKFTSKVNYRNHRKIVVIDGKTGFVGGMNIADRYIEGTSAGIWRDTHFKIEGSGVLGLQAAFMIDWSISNKTTPIDEKYYPKPETFGSNMMQIATGGPFGQWRILQQGYLAAIASAKRSIYIQTPYFIPSESLNSALQAAALAGIDVKLMMPEKSDSKIIDRAAHSFLDDMLKAGVKVYFYNTGFLHSKLLIVDAQMTIIGSANMDFRSFEHNFEISAFVYDARFAEQMTDLFNKDMESCRRLLPSKWFRRPFRQKVGESFMRLFSPLM